MVDVNLVIADMKRRKLSRNSCNLGKMEKQEVEVKEFTTPEITSEIISQLLIQAYNNEIPTIDSIKKELKEGIRQVLDYHHFKRGIMSHDCCFVEYANNIYEVIEKVLDKNRLLKKCE